MNFVPFDKMKNRVTTAATDSDTTYFYELLYFGEMVLKTAVSGMVAAIEDDRERHRYRLMHKLVHADGLGEWFDALNDALSGPASQCLIPAAYEEQAQLTKKVISSSWQYEATRLLDECYRAIDTKREPLTTKIDCRKWFQIFVELRNATRGHGAPMPGCCAMTCMNFQKSIELICDNLCLFSRDWAYLYRNLSGKYRVTKLAMDCKYFEPLKSDTSYKYEDGVYVFFDKPVRVGLIRSNVDAEDFFYPNGAFNGKKFELLSYLTGNKLDEDCSPYLAPTTELPTSETQGLGALEVQGRAFGNLPPKPEGYVQRSELEREVGDALVDDRHPVITLAGRGGIGKTHLALTVLHDIANYDRYSAIIWFSARDIDLLASGPKLVKPKVLTETDIANEFVRLIEPNERHERDFKPVQFLADSLQKSQVGPILFVFDNFETVRDPSALYAWLDTYIRLPNKVLITTRFRDFKGDYNVDVKGMTDSQCNELIDLIASDFQIVTLINRDCREDILKESDGHPYVIKILLGEIAKAGEVRKIERIVATKDEILDALFERTYAGLSPGAKRIFLTLCHWRSVVPQLAVEAVLMRPSNEAMNVESATDELYRSSLIELLTSAEDKNVFLSVPLAASVFGQRKLTASPLKSLIDADRTLLFTFGAALPSSIDRGVGPRVEKMFKRIASMIASGESNLSDHVPMLEFVARKYPPAWLLLASLFEESTPNAKMDMAKDYIRRFIENTSRTSFHIIAWNKLVELCQRTHDWSGEIHAMVEICEFPETDYKIVSNSANRLNALLSQQQMVLDTYEKEVVVSHLVEIMVRRSAEADGTDYSRLAWLCMRLNRLEKAREYASIGLEKDPYNQHCVNLMVRLQ